MFSVLFFAVLCVSCLAGPGVVNYSYSVAVGTGSGTSFSTVGQGRITAVRAWETNSAYVTGFQLRYGYIWSERVGRELGPVNEIELFEGEKIIQISGKYNTQYIYQLRFGTSMGRSLTVGQPSTTSFNFYPKHQDSELRLLSGRFNNAGIVSLGAHWGSIYIDQGNSTDSS